MISFGEIFNDFTIERQDKSGTKIQTIQIPIQYGPKHSWYQRIKADPNLDRQLATQLPRMAFQMVGLTYNANRQLPPTQRYKAVDGNDADKFLSIYMPVPYDLIVDLNVVSKSMDEALIIVEQILPFFTPSLNMSVNVIPELGIKHDIPIQLDSLAIEDNFEGAIDDNRIIIFSLNFQMKVVLYGPRNRDNIIKQSRIDSTITSNCDFLALN